MTSVVERPGDRAGSELDSPAPEAANTVVRRQNRAAKFGKAVLRQWPPIVLFLVVLIGWELSMSALSKPLRYLPPPSDVLDEMFRRPGWYWSHTTVTLKEAGLGFLIGGTLAGVFAVIMAEWKILDRALLPLFVIVKVTPAYVLAPFFVILLGFGMGPKVILAVLTVFYALLINALTGFKSIDEGALEVMDSVNASRFEVFYRLRLPNSLPYLFSAAKIGVPLAVLGAVFAEIYNSKEGLGNIVRTASEFGGFAAIWSAIYILAVLGLVLIGLVTLFERRMLRWHVSQKT